MKTRIKLTVFLFVFLCVNNTSNAQSGWTSAVGYMFRGNIRTFTILNAYGETVDKEEFTNLNDQVMYMRREDSIRNSGRISPGLLKFEYEKIYPFVLVSVDSTVKMKFNGRGQLLERQEGNLHEWNTFSEDGKIIAHIRSERFSEVIKGGGVESRKPKDAMPDYVFSNTVSAITIFKYNNRGSLLELEYYNSDPSKNVRIANTYNQRNDLTECNYYNYENISWKFLKEDYLEKFIHTKIDNLFLIDTYYPDYWCDGTPLKETWTYNNKGKKTNYRLYNGHNNTVGFEARWSYNASDVLMEEWQYNIFLNSPEELKCLIVFDYHGNIISETRYLDFSREVYIKYKYEYY